MKEIPMSADAHEYLNTVEPIRFTDDRGNPGLSYTGQQVVNAYKAGAATSAIPPEAVSGPKCRLCDGTGYYDYAGLSMDPCHHCGPAA